MSQIDTPAEITIDELIEHRQYEEIIPDWNFTIHSNDNWDILISKKILMNGSNLFARQR
jgi:hypothetical protein